MLDARSLALCAQVCRRLRTTCMDNSIWSLILQRTWHWGSISDARTQIGTRCDAVLYSHTHRRVNVGTRLLLQYPRDAAADSNALKSDCQQDPWLLGVVHGCTSGCFLLDWPGYSEDRDTVVDFRNQPMDLRGERMRLRVSFPPKSPGSQGADIGDATSLTDIEGEGDIDDKDVLTEEQIESLNVGDVIRVWEGQWDCGIIRACNVVAHRVALLGDGEAQGSNSTGIGGIGSVGTDAGIQNQQSLQEQQELGGGSAVAATVDENHTAVTPAIVAAVAATGADYSTSEGDSGASNASPLGRLLDLALFASRGKLRFANDVRPSGGSAILRAGERQHQLAQWQYGLGDLVWARLKPFPPWPAVISCNPKSCAWRRGDQYRQVVFFGDYTHRAMPVGDLVAFDRATLQSYSNSGWQSMIGKHVQATGCVSAVDTGRKSAQYRLRQRAIDAAFRVFFLPSEQGAKVNALHGQTPPQESS